MPLARLPITGSDANTWSDILNRNITQTNSALNGAFNSFDQFSQRPTNLTADDVGKTFLYTQTGNWHEWSGTEWKVQNKSFMNVKDYGAVGDGVADDTVAIQNCLNDQTYPQAYTLFFPDGSYAVSSLYTSVSEKILNFGVANLMANSNSPKKAILEIRNHATKINGMRLDGAFKTNYDCALSFNSIQNGDFPNFCYINGLTIFNAKIGVLYGAITNPISDTVSENHITLMRTRSVEKCIFANQVPLGWLYVGNSVLDCQAYDWGTSPNFDHNNSCIYEGGAITSFNNCEFVKAESRLGNAFVNNFQLHITGCSAEIACTLIRLKDTAITQISNFNIPFYNSISTIFDIDHDSKGDLFVTNMRINRVTGASDPTNAVYTNNPIINTKAAKNWIIRFHNCLFSDQVDRLLQSSYSTNISHTLSDISFRDCFLLDSKTKTKISFSDENLMEQAGYFLDLNNFDISTPAGSSLSLVTSSLSGVFSKALKLSNNGNVNCSFYSKKNLIKYQNRVMMLEFYQKSNVPNNTGLEMYIYYFESDQLINSLSLTNSSGGVGHLSSSNTEINYVLNRFLIPQNTQADQIQIEFKINNVPIEWNISKIKIS